MSSLSPGCPRPVVPWQRRPAAPRRTRPWLRSRPQPAQGSVRPKTEAYDFHLPGLPLLLVPAWVIGSWFQLWWPATIVFMCLIGALVALNVFLLAHEMTGKLWIAIAVWLPIAFTNPVMSYSYLIFTELPTGLLLIYA